ncbi:MAG: tetratricopeptide repeat protein [Acidobacteriota bacterium]|nr:tetratricopeptide repeat protein [Acidobacteriota bacterium]
MTIADYSLVSLRAQGVDQFTALLKQGFALHQQARFTEAIPVLERARQLEPNDYFANLLLGIDLLRTGRPMESLPRLELAVRVRPAEDIPEGYLGEANATLGRYAQAAIHYRNAVVRSHNGESALEAWADYALERFHQIGEELRASSTGIATVRRLQAAAKLRGSMSCVASIPTLERRLADEGLAHPTPQSADTAYRLSVCYAVEAGKVETQLDKIAKDGAAIHLLRGDVLLRLNGDAMAAQGEYKQAIALRPGDPSLMERLASAQLIAGDMDAAKQSAQAALALDPHRREAMRTLAAQAMINRDYEQALPWLEKLADQSPADRMVQVQLGRALAQTGHPAEALMHLAPALAAGYPDEKGALHALLARVYRELGRDADAANAAATARRLSDAFQNGNKNATGESEYENE